MKLNNILTYSIILGLILTTKFVLAESDETAELSDSAQTVVSETPLPLEQIKTFAEIFSRIKLNYVRPVSDEKLLEYAVEGMLNGLDPHSVYLKGERFEELTEGTTGQFGGLGIEVMMEDGFVKVITPIDDTPAARAGIKSGDVIIRVDGKSMSGESLNDVSEKLRGEPGSSVTITVLRETDTDPLVFEMERALVQTRSVKSKQLSESIGYLRVSQFQVKTAELFNKELLKLRDTGDIQGLVIDLRNNPGGLLNSAVSIANNFIKQGIIVSTKGRHSENNQEFSASPTDILNGKPIVVLINEGSASASEIVAGALQDHKRALIVGTQSFGKGSVQTVVNIGDTEAIKLTTARYYTPSGRSIQAAGIEPDVLVEFRQFKDQEQRFERLKENDLPGHLENENKKLNSKKSDSLDEQLSKDYQLHEAFNVLKALVIFNSSTADDDKSFTEQEEKTAN